MKRTWGRLKPDIINIDIKAGFDDPMYTGLICGLYSQFLYFLNNDNIKFEPVFDANKFEGSFYLRGSIWTIYLLVVFLQFLVSTPIRKEIKLMRKKMGGAKYAGQFQYK